MVVKGADVARNAPPVVERKKNKIENFRHLVTVVC